MRPTVEPLNPQVPHNFPSLRNGNRKPVIVIGAGMSVPEVPAVNQLFNQKRVEVEDRLDCHTTGFDDPNDKMRFYRWAQQIINSVDRNKHKCPRLALAKALGLTTDPRWLADIDLSVTRAAPRHRVMARFAREGRWSALWSLNWDCCLESGLRSVGLRLGNQDDGLPWPTRYQPLIKIEDTHAAANAKVIPVYKPHGCITTMIEADQAMESGQLPEATRLSEHFIITADDIARIGPEPTRDVLFTKLKDHLRDCPLVVAGWSVSEPYLVELFQQKVKPIKSQNPISADEITVIDIKFQSKHGEVAACYARSEQQCYVRVNGFTGDCLFLWLQSLYALEHLKNNADASVRPVLENLLTLYQSPIENHFVIEWADYFLPSWVRLCWCAGLVEYYKNGQLVPAHKISMDLPDEHIPWNLDGCQRHDLRAAARILAAFPQNGGEWKFSSVPGAFWHTREHRLVIPLPGWADVGEVNFLRAIDPLLRVINAKLPNVAKVDILPVGRTLEEGISNNLKEVLRNYVAKRMSHTHFAANLEITEATTLLGGTKNA